MVPEKASSFNIHPERTCSDCCFFCRQKFGLFDTPLHISQMKSLEIQKFATEYSKCGKDGCLCDKCYRLVEREGRKAKRESEGEPRDSAPEKVRSCFVRNCNKEVKSHMYMFVDFMQNIVKLGNKELFGHLKIVPALSSQRLG